MDLVMRMKTLPDLTNEKAWETVYEGAAEIEKLRASLSASVEVQMKLAGENEELIRGMTEMAERFNRAMAPYLLQP
jgi:hypothetical protein